MNAHRITPIRTRDPTTKRAVIPIAAGSNSEEVPLQKKGVVASSGT
jgi:hypothetical protein